MVLSRAYESMQLGSGCKFGARLIPELPKVIYYLARAHPAEQRLYAGVPAPRTRNLGRKIRRSRPFFLKRHAL